MQVSLSTSLKEEYITRGQIWLENMKLVIYDRIDARNCVRLCSIRYVEFLKIGGIKSNYYLEVQYDKYDQQH